MQRLDAGATADDLAMLATLPRCSMAPADLVRLCRGMEAST
jgi:hypothetical protein